MNIATKVALGLAFAVSLALLQGPVRAGEVLKPTLDINDMRVVVTYVSTNQLVNLQRKFGAHIDLRDPPGLPPRVLDLEDEPRDRRAHLRDLPAQRQTPPRSR